MITTEHQQLLAEKSFLNRDLAEMPATALLTRRSLEARLRKVEAAIAAMDQAGPAPARARLTFNGLPVVGSHGIFADFGMKAMSSFTEAVAAMAASLSAPLAPLAPMGPIPNRDQNQLLITNTALGSFGFELEEYRPQQPAVAMDSPVAIALERTRSLLQSTQGNDEELADVASETDQRALEKVRAFLRVLSENDAVCALQYGDAVVRFQDVGKFVRVWLDWKRTTCTNGKKCCPVSLRARCPMHGRLSSSWPAMDRSFAGRSPQRCRTSKKSTSICNFTSRSR